MTTEREPISEESSNENIDWHTIDELLEKGLYERIAEFLQHAHLTSDQVDEVLIDQILAAAYQISLVLVENQAEESRLRQARKAVSHRNQTLQQHLRITLETVSHFASLKIGLVSDEAPPALPKPEAPEGLLRRIQSLLGWRANTKLPAQPEEDEAVLEETPSFVSPIEAPEMPVISPTEKEEAAPPTPIPTETLEEPFSRLPAEEHRVPALQTPKKRELPTALPAGPNEISIAPFVAEGKDLPELAIYCLGPFRVYHNDKLITEWNSLKGQGILKYLIVHNDRSIGKDILMDVFWPDADPGDARRNLHQAIYNLRQTFRRRQPSLKPILFERDSYLLNPDMVIWLDFEKFERHGQAGQLLDADGQHAAAIAEYNNAEMLYQGDFLEEDVYTDWSTPQRNHLRNLYLDVTDRLSEYYVQHGEFTTAIAVCQKILYRDNCHEQAHRCLMQCYLSRGQRPLAVRQYQACVQALQEELDLPPSEETEALYQRFIAP